MRASYRLVLVLTLFSGFANASMNSFNASDSTRDVFVNFNITDDTVDITLDNLESNPTDVSQNLSDLSFTLSTTPTSSGTLSSSSGTELTVNGNGSYTVGSAVATGWVLSETGPSFELTVLGTPSAPTHTIIGPSSNGTYSGGSYSNANGSIAGNNAHNPFLESGVTFAIAVPGVTALTTVTSVTFSFGTTAGVDLPGTPQVPEPFELGLTGAGLLLLSLIRRHAQSKRALEISGGRAHTRHN